MLLRCVLTPEVFDLSLEQFGEFVHRVVFRRTRTRGTRSLITGRAFCSGGVSRFFVCHCDLLRASKSALTLTTAGNRVAVIDQLDFMSHTCVQARIQLVPRKEVPRGTQGSVGRRTNQTTPHV